MSKTKPNIIIMGGGAWGAAIGCALSANRTLTATCLVRGEATCEALSSGTVPRLSHMPLPHPLKASLNTEILATADAIYLVLPAAATHQAMRLIADIAPATSPVILCAKGLIDNPDSPDDDHALFLPEYMAAFHQSRAFALLSGPSFADEVIKGLPAALTAASPPSGKSANLAKDMISHFTNSSLRLYHNDDPIGVAVGGATKNVIALAAGICAGLGLGDNAKAALITRGLAETGRLITALGGNSATISGLACMGDLTLTAAGPHSRNMAYGLALGEGKPLPSALAEGARTAPLLANRAAQLGIDMPITQAVTHALSGGDLTTIITDLLNRPSVME